MLTILLTFITFFVCAVISFYIPGRIVINYLKLSKSRYERFIISWIFGLALFILLSYSVAFFHLNFLLYIYIIAGLLLFIKDLKFRSQKSRSIIKQVDPLLLIITIIGSLSFLSITFFSGILTSGGMQFIGTNSTDGFVNLAYVKNQMIDFPPQHPGIADIPLRGYHFFYDFLLSRFAVLFHFSPEDLFFRLFPFLISALYGGGILLLAKQLTQDNTKLRIVLFLSYFAQSTTSVLLLFKKDYDFLGINQPPMLINDPSVVIGIAFLTAALSLLPKIKQNLNYAIIAGIILGLLTQLKVYSGIIGILTIIVFSIYIMITENRKYLQHYLLLIIITGILTFLTFGLNTVGSGSLVFAPLLFYEQYMQGANFSYLKWQLKMLVYREHNNIIRIIQLYLEAVAFVWFINLGAKLIIIFQIYKLFRKDFWINNYSSLLFITIAIAIGLPSFFIQSVSIFDIIQFFWISLVLLSIPAGIIFGTLFNRVNRLGKIVILAVLLFSSYPGYSYVVTSYLFPEGVKLIPNNELPVLNKIPQIVPVKNNIIFLSQPDFHSHPVFAAMTGRSIYFEGLVTPYVNPDIIKERKANVAELLTAVNACESIKIKQIVARIGTRYIITEKPSECLSSLSIKKNKVESSSVSFYEVK